MSRLQSRQATGRGGRPCRNPATRQSPQPGPQAGGVDPARGREKTRHLRLVHLQMRIRRAADRDRRTHRLDSTPLPNWSITMTYGPRRYSAMAELLNQWQSGHEANTSSGSLRTRPYRRHPALEPTLSSSPTCDKLTAAMLPAVSASCRWAAASRSSPCCLRHRNPRAPASTPFTVRRNPRRPLWDISTARYLTKQSFACCRRPPCTLWGHPATARLGTGPDSVACLPTHNRHHPGRSSRK